MYPLKSLVLVVLLNLFYLSNSMAGSCVPFDVDKNFERASFVFDAYMVKSELVRDINGKVGPWEKDDGPFIIGNFIVSKYWKGNPSALDGVITHSETPACGLTLAVARRYIFFVYEVATDNGLITDDNYGVVSYCGGPYGRNYELIESTEKWLNSK